QKMAMNIKNNKTDTWDVQWLFTIFRHKGLCVVPQKNLITNIGFGNEATHTKKIDLRLIFKKNSLPKPYSAPKKIETNEQADKKLYFTYYETSWKTKSINIVYSIINRLY